MTLPAVYTAAAHWRYTPTAALTAAIALLVAAALGRRRASRPPAPVPRRRHAKRAVPGARAAYVVSVACTGVSLDTSWYYFGDRGLHIQPLIVHIALFAVLELALIACGLMMRAGIQLTGHPGPARTVAWACCGASAYMAWQVSGPLGGTARVALGPLLGLWMLHLALGIEVRARRGKRTGTLARIVGELRERMISRLGLADDNRKAAERTRDRAARRAARLILANGGQGRRAARALRASNAGHDPAARHVLLVELAAIKHAAALATLPLESPWDPDLARPTLAAAELEQLLMIMAGVNPIEDGRSRPSTVEFAARLADRASAPTPRCGDAVAADAIASPAGALDAVPGAAPDARDAADAVDAHPATSDDAAHPDDAADAYFSAVMDGAALAAATPPPWEGITAGDAVLRADALLGKRTAPQLVAALAQVGISITEGYVRTARSRAARAARDAADGAHQERGAA